MSVRPWLVSRVLFPLYHHLKNDGLPSAVRTLEKTQWWSAEELRAMQMNKLGSLLRHCRTNVPYYRELFDIAGLPENKEQDYEYFTRLPYLTKKIIADNQDRLVAENVSPKELLRNSTSGSTGEPLVFYNDRRSQVWRQAVVLRNQEWVGALYSDREVRLWGAQIDLRKVESIRGRLHSWLHQKLFLSSYELSDEAMRRYAEIIYAFQARLLISYPSPLATFSEFLRRNEIHVSGIRSIITSAETLYQWQRELIEQVFGAQVYDRYGCREFGNIAHECAAHEGYHVNVERFFIEILNDEGLPVAPGELGSLYITDLDNYGFPFVRYQIGDLAVNSSKLCSCARGLPMIERVEGRSFDVIECPNGNRVAGTYWTITLRAIPGIDKFQVEQPSLDYLIVRIIKNEEYSNASCEVKIRDIVRDKCGSEMSVVIEYVDHIALTSSGKERMVVSMKARSE